MERKIRIGTRDSQLATWQAEKVRSLLHNNGFDAELVYIKSEGDIDLKTPLYEMGVEGIFTRSLDLALLNDRIDIAVHSMKDVPTKLPVGICQAAILERGPTSDLLVHKGDWPAGERIQLRMDIATSSIRRRAQWLNRYPTHVMHNLRGNMNTRLKKLTEEKWDAAIFAQAGLERINLRPDTSFVLEWMLPAPAQGAILVVCRDNDRHVLESCTSFHHRETALCTKIERDFLRGLMGGCTTPISALAELEGGRLEFQGSILSPDGLQKFEVKLEAPMEDAEELGTHAAKQIFERHASQVEKIVKNAR
jgi:hydroxymethylbilane synthase